MSNIKVTEKLAQTIKEERLKKNISARQLSDRLDRSVSYVSSLERCKIDYIDSDLFIKIFKIILNTSEKEFDKYMNDLLADIRIKLDDDELEDQKWILQFNLIIRKIPITTDIVEYIKNKLEELNKTPADLVRKINENTYLDDKESLKENELNIFSNNNNEIGWSYKFKVSDDFITNILERKVTKINYIGMLGIIYNLFIFEDVHEDELFQKSEKFLKEHKFYTLKQIVKSREESLLKKMAATTNDLKSEDFNYSINLELPEYEIEFEENLNKLKKVINSLRNKDVEQTLKTLKTLNKNIEFDYKFMLAMLQLPFFALENLDFDEKQKFLLDVAKLLKTTAENNKEKTVSKD